MSVEWVQRLRGFLEYCPTRRSPDSSCPNHRQSGASFHSAHLSSTRFVYRNAGGATVTAAGLSGPPDRVRKHLLQWLAFISQASFVVYHFDYAPLVGLRRTKVDDNITYK